MDPRIRRTRKLLQDALQKVLEKKEFDEISVQDITDAATVNRATFYDHFTDKFALLNCMVGGAFHELLAVRQVHFDGGCGSALKATVLAVCDYVMQMQGSSCERPPQPHMEAAIIAVLRRMFVEGLREHAPNSMVPPEIIAASASWAIYGAVREWAQTPSRQPSDEIAETVAKLVAPILHQSYEAAPTQH